MKSSKSDVVVAHTPTPWVIHERTGRFQITPHDNEFFTCAAAAGFNTQEAKANAELIVRAVNCHDDLLEACKALVADGECSCVSYRTKGQCPQCRAREVIDRATIPQKEGAK